MQCTCQGVTGLSAVDNAWVMDTIMGRRGLDGTREEGGAMAPERRLEKEGGRGKVTTGRREPDMPYWSVVSEIDTIIDDILGYVIVRKGGGGRRE